MPFRELRPQGCNIKWIMSSNSLSFNVQIQENGRNVANNWFFICLSDRTICIIVMDDLDKWSPNPNKSQVGQIIRWWKCLNKCATQKKLSWMSLCKLRKDSVQRCSCINEASLSFLIRPICVVVQCIKETGPLFHSKPVDSNSGSLWSNQDTVKMES